MKRIVAVLLLIVFLSFVLAQEAQYRKYPPKPSEFARASNSCTSKRKLYVSSIQGVPVGHDASGSARVSCQFRTLDCRGRLVIHASQPRDGGQHVCDDWEAARDAVERAAIDSCCDPEDTNQTQPADDEKPECPPATSWFDDSAPCKERRALWAAVRKNEVVVTICGYEVFRHAASYPDKLWVQAYRESVAAAIRGSTGSTICCDRFREAVKSGRPCDPSKDLDCDGIPNQTDTRKIGNDVFPAVDAYIRAPGARIDPFPPGLDAEDPDFLPNRTARNSKDVGDCPCKWQLIKGELKCGQGGQGRHVYLATWRCPTTKAEVITTKYASGQISCP
jgi:hypothetical protein